LKLRNHQPEHHRRNPTRTGDEISRHPGREILKSISKKGMIPAGDDRIMSELASKAATNMASQL
jgi:hypothetical protein